MATVRKTEEAPSWTRIRRWGQGAQGKRIWDLISQLFGVL